MAQYGLWQIYCIEEDLTLKTTSFTEPTQCPNIHGDRSIDSNQTVLLDYIQVTNPATPKPGNAVSLGRNWLFGSAQSGGAGNVGLEVKLNQGIDILLIKFSRDPSLHSTGGDFIESMSFLIYSNKAFTLRLSLFECDNGDSSATQISHGASDQAVTAGGSQPEASCPQLVTFTFSSPIQLSKEVMEVYLHNVSSSSAPTAGVWQLIATGVGQS